MDKKLTLSINEKIIQKAKAYAEKNSTSLSRIIESYLSLLTNQEGEEIEVTPLIKSISGKISLPKNYDYKKSKAKYLMDKHK